MESFYLILPGRGVYIQSHEYEDGRMPKMWYTNSVKARRAPVGPRRFPLSNLIPVPTFRQGLLDSSWQWTCLDQSWPSSHTEWFLATARNPWFPGKPSTCWFCPEFLYPSSVLLVIKILLLTKEWSLNNEWDAWSSLMLKDLNNIYSYYIILQIFTPYESLLFFSFSKMTQFPQVLLKTFYFVINLSFRIIQKLQKICKKR